jgi:methanethiol S-methyltransferase
MQRVLAAMYSAFSYLFFLVTFVYAILFVEGVFVPKTIDSGPVGDPVTSVLINLGVLGIFAVQHSVMARPAFKRWWTKIIPEEIERSTYVLLATLALALVVWQWRPLPQLVWSIDNPVLAGIIVAISWGGWALLLASTFLISHFQLFGLSQGFAKLIGRKPEDPPFTTPLFYKFMRHPLYAGFVIAFWAAPQMSVGHLLFAAATTAYILIGIFLEERDLIAIFGDRYRAYSAQVGMFWPKFGARRGKQRV